jgi:alpha-beta hydrolase superfamily lysophospholipase
MNQDPISIGMLKAWLHTAAGEPRARILLVHGLGEHSGRHVETARFLAGKGYEVVRFDSRGCGQSQGKRQWIDSFDDYVADVRAVAARIKRNRPPLPLYLFGHSLGGAIVLHAAAESPPGALAGVILTAPAYLPGGGISAAKIAVGKMIERLTPSLRIPGSLDVTAISREQSVVDAYRNDPLNCSFNTVRQGNEILRALEHVPELCAKITVPVLLAHGDADRLVKIEGSRRIMTMLAATDKTLKVFPGAFHELHNDLDRGAFFAAVDEWLRRHAA